ncbi:YdbH domain-containing protein [Thalassobaculum sp. OXR-137]|uniref:intermembrane phospholipid transport protein YdbH family protein n=1 Tax=Thalassobaculum sp. OXR-137 TaxID=3100173 RepID=UPI002AC8E4C7|nr:YdbH domain-containing protein [Thalassobaculum sp. OXR-137]WPZ35045.1 YdbH domain-containing protein [Thalassobaculum sp. OXR-137]
MRWLARILLVVLLILAIGLPVAWLTRDAWAPSVAKWGVNTWASGRGSDGPVVTDLGFRIDSVSPDRLSLSAVAVNGPGGLSAEQVELGYDWRDLIKGEVRSVTLDGLHLTLTIDEDGSVTLGPLEPIRALASGGDGEGGTPAPVVRFSDAVIDVEGVARGSLTASGTLGESDGTLGLAADGSGAVEGADWRAEGSGRFQVSLGDGATRLNATLTEARVRRGDLSASGLRGTASVNLSPSGDIEAIADLRADSAEADGVAVAVPSAHLRMDPLGLSAVFRLGDRDDPDLRLAVSAEALDGQRRPVTIDLNAELTTIDQLVAAALRQPARGAEGHIEGTLRGSVPEDLSDIHSVWDGTVAAGGLTVDAVAPDGDVQARIGIAMAAGTLALETLEPAQLAVAGELIPEALAALIGEGVVTATLGGEERAFRLTLRDPFAAPTLSLGGPLGAAVDGGASLGFDGDAGLQFAEDGVRLTAATGTAKLADIVSGDLRLRSASLVLDSLSGGAEEIAGEGLLIAHLDAGDARGLRVSLPLRVVHDGNGTAAFLERQGSITVPQLPKSTGVALAEPLTLRLRESERPVLRKGFDDPEAIRLELPLVMPATTATVDGGAPVRVDLGAATGMVRARMEGSRAGAVLRVTTPKVDVAPADEAPDAPDGIALAGVALEMRASTLGDGLTLDGLVVSADRMSDRARSVRFSPLRVSGEATRTANGALAFSASFGGADGAFVLDATGVHNLAKGTGRADITLYPLVFVPGGLQPVDLSPAAAAILRNASGKVSLEGTIEWPGRDVPPDDPLTLTVEDLSFTGSLGTVSGLTGAVGLSSIDPLTTLDGQVLKATGIDVGVPIGEPSVTFHVDPDLNLVLEQVTATFADGRVHTSDVTIPLTSDQPVSMVLDVDGVDAARLAEVTELDGLTASGSLTGRLPLVWDFDEGLSVRNAQLSATNPGGTVKYRPESPPAALQDAGEEVSLLMQAVRNLVYEKFDLEVNGRPGEPFDIKLRVRGANPDLFDGYPVALNVTLTGRLDEMFLNARRTLGLSDVLRRKLEARNAGG